MATTTLETILAQFRDDARNNRDLGDRFERLMQQFFRLDPLYAGLFSEVWMWNEWPLKGQVGDLGIDLVAQHKAKRTRRNTMRGGANGNSVATSARSFCYPSKVL